MAGSVNKVILVGNLGRDPEVRYTQDGAKIVHLAIATSERWRDRTSGENRERTEWHRVVIFNERLGEVAEKYLSKGRSVYLEGQLQTRKWQDQSGQERYTTEVVLQRFRGELVLLGGRDESGGGPADDDVGAWGRTPRQPARGPCRGRALVRRRRRRLGSHGERAGPRRRWRRPPVGQIRRLRRHGRRDPVLAIRPRRLVPLLSSSGSTRSSGRGDVGPLPGSQRRRGVGAEGQAQPDPEDPQSLDARIKSEHDRFRVRRNHPFALDR